MIVFCKTIDSFTLMFSQSSMQIVGYTDIHSSVGCVCKYVNVIHLSPFLRPECHPERSENFTAERWNGAKSKFWRGSGTIAASRSKTDEFVQRTDEEGICERFMTRLFAQSNIWKWAVWDAWKMQLRLSRHWGNPSQIPLHIRLWRIFALLLAAVRHFATRCEISHPRPAKVRLRMKSRIKVFVPWRKTARFHTPLRMTLRGYFSWLWML